MKANETHLRKFMSQDSTRFIIPIYQRNYDWTKNQCKELLDDIFRAGKSKDISAHFIGSIVHIDDVYASADIEELMIIDGQQRLTTITLIYLAILNVAVRLKDETLEKKIEETYLINKFSKDEELKLRLTENNDKALKYLLRNDNEGFDQYSRLIVNYDYFKTEISEKNYQVVETGLNKLMFVAISLDRGNDDPQKIFESLNSTGLALSEADLIRNYILMGLERKDQNKIYNDYWVVIEKNAKETVTKETAKNASKVSDFIRDYLTIKTKKITNKSKVYQTFKEKFPNLELQELEKVLEEIKNYVYLYTKIINPEQEPDKEIRLQLNYNNRLQISVSYPFLLQVYDDYSKKEINKKTFIQVLKLVQSFVWRRFILGLPTNVLSHIFMGLYEDVDKNHYIKSLQRALLNKKGSQRFPNDEEVIKSLKGKIFNKATKKRVYFLERLENHDNPEKVVIEGNSDITIEHIFPQNPDPKWKVELDKEEFDLIKKDFLHTIANLTLSGNNLKLSNKNFLEKRDMNIDGKEQGYKYSRLWLNKYLSQCEKWGREEFEKRFEIISARFKKIWQYPEI